MTQRRVENEERTKLEGRGKRERYDDLERNQGLRQRMLEPEGASGTRERRKRARKRARKRERERGGLRMSGRQCRCCGMRREE